jgi:FkbM family methyltransferase
MSTPSCTQFRPGSILDAGANIGAPSVAFALQYPAALIVAVEPSRDNFAVLEMNTARFAGIRRERRGLWPKSTHLRVARMGEATRGRHWGLEVRETTPEESDVKGVSIDALAAKHGVAGFDMLKINIEGAEMAVFDGQCSASAGALQRWLLSVQLTMAEVHMHEMGHAPALARPHAWLVPNTLVHIFIAALFTAARQDNAPCPLAAVVAAIDATPELAQRSSSGELHLWRVS